MRDRRGFRTSHWARGTRDIRDVREEGVGVRSLEHKDTGLGTLPSLRVWKDRDIWRVCPGDSRSQESKSPAALLPPPQEAWTISILRPQPSPWAAAAVTSQAQLLHHHLTGPPSPSGEKACAQDLRMSPGTQCKLMGLSGVPASSLASPQRMLSWQGLCSDAHASVLCPLHASSEGAQTHMDVLRPYKGMKQRGRGHEAGAGAALLCQIQEETCMPHEWTWTWV